MTSYLALHSMIPNRNTLTSKYPCPHSCKEKVAGVNALQRNAREQTKVYVSYSGKNCKEPFCQLTAQLPNTVFPASGLLRCRRGVRDLPLRGRVRWRRHPRSDTSALRGPAAVCPDLTGRRATTFPLCAWLWRWWRFFHADISLSSFPTVRKQKLYSLGAHMGLQVSQEKTNLM